LKTNEEPNFEDQELLGHVVRMNLVHCNENIKQKNLKKQNTVFHYFKGNDPSSWASNVEMFEEILIQQVYEGIDLRYYFQHGMLRYDFIVQPNADPNVIQLSFEGDNRNFIDKKGDLIFHTRFGEVRQSELFTYQQIGKNKSPIASQFIKSGNKFQFEVGNYDQNFPLIIDPLIYSTYLGKEFSDDASGMHVSADGSVYLSGATVNSDFPISTGAYNTTFAGVRDLFITKFNPTGNNILFSTFYGGNSTDESASLFVDANGNLYLTGITYSQNLPTTPGVIGQTWNGGVTDAFVAKFNPEGSQLIYSTYLGGSIEDYGTKVLADNNGNAYAVGSTRSFNFPTTSGAFRQFLSSGSFGNWNDVYVTKINPDGTSLIYSTYIGGNESENANDAVLDDDGNVFITGTTFSLNYPVTQGSIKQTLSGNRDAFVTKLNADGSALIYSTYLGGNNLDDGNAIAIDPDGNAYVTGLTLASDFPVTSNAFEQDYIGNSDAFLSKINAAGTQLVYSTYLGAGGDDKGRCVFVKNGFAYVGLECSSLDFPTTSDAFNTTNNGSIDILLLKMNTSGSDLEYATYLGGSSVDLIYSIFVDDSEFIYMSGATISNNYPVTSGAYDETYNLDKDVFLTKFSILCNDFNLNIDINGNTLTSNQTNATYQWLDCNNNFSEIEGATAVSFTPTESGSYAVALTADGCTLNSACIELIISGISKYLDANIDIFPNPSDGHFTLKTKNINLLNFKIYDLSGRMVQHVTTNKFITDNSLEFDISNLMNGLYILTFETLDNRIISKKIALER
jgi:hypothetical protein